ncbi:hypothetical protein CKO40_04245 [Halochromatium glycolicum]|uniref:Uncharacterized protein n=1 Tax=Halochromatium glycolicum TaxID=85075 RepID=A0AAJ0U234_9GAMM|nr:hypothetical protein [Halochromatium glycolicum]
MVGLRLIGFIHDLRRHLGHPRPVADRAVNRVRAHNRCERKPLIIHHGVARSAAFAQMLVASAALER